MPWLDVFCPGCGTSRAIELQVDRHPLASVGTLVLGQRCSWCQVSAVAEAARALCFAVPVGMAERLAMEFDVDPVLLGQPQQKVARHPDLVGGLLRTLAEDLKFPLALRHLGVDAFMVDPGREAGLKVLLDDLARDVADVLVADADGPCGPG